MKKISITLFMMAALMISLSTYAQDSKKEATPKAKTEQAEKKSGEEKACCAEKKEKACCADKAGKKDETCCKEKGKKAKPSSTEAGTETKSCGKKK
jgi:hypothetical protein